jgi:predicted  nucleic acid-binding Zn-ribbon protein
MDSINEKIDQLSREIARVSSQQAGLNQQLVHLMSELEELKKQVSGGDQKIKDTPVKVTEIAEVITAPIIQVVPKSETAIKSKPKELSVHRSG